MKKKVKNPFKKNSLYWRYLTHKILVYIGFAIYEYTNQDCKKTYETIHSIGITNIILKKESLLSHSISDIINSRSRYNIYIEMHRPGIFIGKKGELIDKIKEYLYKRLNASNINIYVFESDIYPHLYAFDCRQF